MPSNHWRGSNDNNVHKGNYYIKNGIEFDENDAMVISSAVTNAVAIRKVSGKDVSFDEVKSIIETCKFAYTATMKNLEYNNDQVRNTNLKPDERKSQSGRRSSATPIRQELRDEIDDMMR